MSMQECDVAIVGAGPAGGKTAKDIAEKGYKVALFEQNKRAGKHLKCAGLVTPRIFDYLDGIPKEKLTLNEVKGANIHSPSGQVLSIGGNKVQALVIDRQMMDKAIADKANEAGARLYLENKVLSVQRSQGKIELKTSKDREFSCKILVGADGPFSKVRGRFSFPEPREMLKGIGAELEGTNLDPNFVEIFVGNKIAPGFFAWIIPTNKKGTCARVGLCIKSNMQESPKYYFSNFLKDKKNSNFFDGTALTKQVGGVIPVGALKKTYGANVMLVGDAAAQVKPTSGGGIYPGLVCAGSCSFIAMTALEKNTFSSQFLKKYHSLWHSRIGRELNMGMKFRNVFKGLTDKQFDNYIQQFNDPKILEVINKYGDIDFPSKLIMPMIKRSPSLIKMLPNLINK
ncbi:MAG: NAD(P)/FAD-dependent oxidoreductase [Candidatus Thermoplasmatota archaeon]|nr:NAD(P)/FAD-dependent oxidoreductase [Candidatus Thermoplasmatota archaeon]